MLSCPDWTISSKEQLCGWLCFALLIMQLWLRRTHNYLCFNTHLQAFPSIFRQIYATYSLIITSDCTVSWSGKNNRQWATYNRESLRAGASGTQASISHEMFVSGTFSKNDVSRGAMQAPAHHPFLLLTNDGCRNISETLWCNSVKYRIWSKSIFLIEFEASDDASMQTWLQWNASNVNKELVFSEVPATAIELRLRRWEGLCWCVHVNVP